MNDVGVIENIISTKALAETLGTRPNVITENAKKCLPDKVIKNGKPTFWTQEEVTVLIDFMKANNNRNDLPLSNRMIGMSTELTPALKIKKAMELMKEGYEEELATLRAKNSEQASIIEAQAPKVKFYDTVTQSEDSMDMRDVAITLNFPKLGRNKIFKILRDRKILDRNNKPYQSYVNQGYFKIVETEKTDALGNTHVNTKTVVFQKGIDFIRKTIEKEYNQ